MADLLVTNFNRNFTGVSATAANVVRQQAGRYEMALVGRALPGCPDPISIAAARAASRHHDPAKPFAIWHVRRNTEMRAAIWARDVLRLPVRIVFTSAAQRRHSAFPRWLISRMDAVIATTEAAATYVPHVRAVVPHGVDTDVFTPAENRSSAWATLGYGGQQGIATIGRIRPEKGTDLFVDAMLRLLPNHPGAVALVIGRAAREHQSFLKGLQAKIAAAGLGERILFPGEIPASDLPRVMRALSLVMQLPRYEGYGMAPLEGLASAVPFVGSDTGYYRAFSAQGTVGTVVPLEAADAAAEAAGQLLSAPEELSRRRQAGRDLAVHAFSARAEADGIDAVYQELWSAS
ncbi:lipopolysaccharide core biosynthesis mannosyltransferase LpcC [Phaeobacter piscinae]|uniref:glycosyltransferase family 4 protein n=1 Tax=Phaeobacter piscinae TaxID=1580596 RepID=UPI000C9A705E|nr:glycosyltransferase family 4 protein [Phaeobacter piscinae]AUQ74957.1 lipopolysaccharide core biosynthesis mannosyltransferase LpcC [Phaeobacter piscinae]AUR35210.1 lipopolysaccharide core biosynthesis mannosyltransferase LpcC [Phaeobacter piscinae]